MSAHFTPQGPYTTGGNFTAGNANNIENGIVAVDNAKADLAGATFTGAVQATNVTATGGITASASNANIELGAKAAANTPFVDFNSSGNSNDYDVRMIASGGTASSGNGTLNIMAASLTHNGQTVWDAANDGSSSGLDADKLDGVQGSGYALVGTHSAGQVIISFGTGVPAALAANEIYIQLS